MTVARVYRPERDWRGQRPVELEDSYIGDLTNVIVGGAAPQPLARFPMQFSTEGQIGVPYEQDSGIVLQPNDLVVIGGVKYIVQGARQWEEDHVFAGPASEVLDDYYWVEIRSTA
jgi:hypothetical protein